MSSLATALAALPATRVPLPGRQRFPLGDSESVWLVAAGSVAICDTQRVPDEDGSRRHLFTVTRGGAVFGMASDTLIAAALEPVELLKFDLGDLEAQWSQAAVRQLVAAWLEELARTAGSPVPQHGREIADSGLRQVLSEAHSEFLRQISDQAVAERQERSRRLQARQEHLLSVTQSVTGELVAVASRSNKVQVDFVGPPLLAAIEAIARATGFRVTAPRRYPSRGGVEEMLRALEHSSHFRSRKVQLENEWWKRDCGPLLSFLVQDGRPVALLPSTAKSYVLFDPATQTEVPVDETAAAGVQTHGYTLYRPLPDSASTPYHLIAFGLRGGARDLVVLLATALAGTFLAMFTPVATATLIDAAIPNADRSLLFQMGVALLVAALGRFCFDLIEVFATARLSTRANAVTQAAVWDHLLRLRPAFLRQYSSGDLASRAMAIGTIFRRVSDTSLRAIFTGVVSLLSLGLMCYYSLTLAVVGFVTGFIIVAATLLSGAAMLRRLTPLQLLQGQLLGLTVQLMNGISKLRVSGTERFAFAHWARRYGEQQTLTLKVQQLRDNVSALNQTVPTLGYVVIFFLAGAALFRPAANGSTVLSPGSFLAFSAAFGVFIGALASVSNIVVDVIEDFNLWHRSKPLLVAKPELDVSKSDPGILRGQIEISHLTFRYHESGPLTLEDVSLHARPGEMVAIVGPSGSGKSTILRLLLGFETPTSGTVYFDGQDLQGLNVLAVRRQLGVVLQSSNLLSGSVVQNIAAGAFITLDQAWEAARKAGIADDIQAWPMGMHTFISEGAVNISMGQRQRLLIARALVFNPRVLLFDEATSALDNRSQEKVSHTLEHLNVTRVVIAHRLSTIQNANRIYVLERGRIVQTGTFGQLSAANGLFQRMMLRQTLSQAEGYSGRCNEVSPEG